MALQVNLSQAVYALSDALDLVGVDDVAHGKRVGIMASECAKALGWSRDDQHALFELGMLHDIGVSSTQTHQHLVSEFDWVGSQHHTEVGHDLLHGFGPLAHMALPVRYHHTPWPELQRHGLSTEVAQRANLIYLVDRVDTLCNPYQADHGVLLHAASICTEIEARRGTHFQPELVDAFLQAARTEAFWLLLEPRAIARTLSEQLAAKAACSRPCPPRHCAHFVRAARPEPPPPGDGARDPPTRAPVCPHRGCQEPLHRAAFARRGRRGAPVGRAHGHRR